MPRQSRKSSGTGIYHVMMRGINHQNIFEDQEDYYQFLNTLDMMAQSYEPDGTPFGRNYILYACDATDLSLWHLLIKLFRCRLKILSVLHSNCILKKLVMLELTPSLITLLMVQMTKWKYGFKSTDLNLKI